MAREFIIDANDRRAFEMTAGSIFVEYKGKPPNNPIHVIEYSAFESASKHIDKLEQRIEKLRAALKFYAKPESIEPYLSEIKIPGTNNTRPQISMEFYRTGIHAIRSDDEAANG